MARVCFFSFPRSYFAGGFGLAIALERISLSTWFFSQIYGNIWPKFGLDMEPPSVRGTVRTVRAGRSFPASLEGSVRPGYSSSGSFLVN